MHFIIKLIKIKIKLIKFLWKLNSTIQQVLWFSNIIISYYSRTTIFKLGIVKYWGKLWSYTMSLVLTFTIYIKDWKFAVFPYNFYLKVDLVLILSSPFSINSIVRWSNGLYLSLSLVFLESLIEYNFIIILSYSKRVYS